MTITVESILYDFKLRRIVVYCSNNRVFIFSSRKHVKNWIQICDSEVETLSHTEIMHMIGGKVSED